MIANVYAWERESFAWEWRAHIHSGYKTAVLCTIGSPAWRKYKSEPLAIDAALRTLKRLAPDLVVNVRS